VIIKKTARFFSGLCSFFIFLALSPSLFLPKIKIPVRPIFIFLNQATEPIRKNFQILLQISPLYGKWIPLHFTLLKSLA